MSQLSGRAPKIATQVARKSHVVEAAQHYIGTANEQPLRLRMPRQVLSFRCRSANGNTSFDLLLRTAAGVSNRTTREGLMLLLLHDEDRLTYSRTDN